MNRKQILITGGTNGIDLGQPKRFSPSYVATRPERGLRRSCGSAEQR
jgi:hypothetical protein